MSLTTRRAAGSRTGRLARRALNVAGLVFLGSYFVGNFTRWGPAPRLMLLALVPLALYAAPHVTGFVRWYAAAAVVAGVAVTVWRPLDLELALASMASMANVIGLLVVLRVVDFPLREHEYRETFERLSLWLRRRRVPDGTSAVALGFLLGQLLAFTVVGVVDAILTAGDTTRTTYVTRWAARGLSATLVWALAFPTVSIAIDILEVPPLSYFVIALPLGLLLGAGLMVLSGRRSGRPAVEAPTRPPPERRPLLELLAYLVAIVGGILLLATVFPGTSYLAVVAVTVVGASLTLSLLQCRRQQTVAASLRRFQTHAVGWWRYGAPEIVIFTSGGLLLYSIQRSGAVEPVARWVLQLGPQPPASYVVYALFSTMVFVLFMIGIHPIVSVHVIAVAITSLSVDWISVPVLTLALMIGTVAALTPSPFSALSNLRAALAGTDVGEAMPENLGYGLALLAAGNIYVLLVRMLGF